MFSALMGLFPTCAHESMCWKSFIFEVIWNLFYVIIVSGHPPKHARKGADIAKDYPGEENKRLSVVTRGDRVGTSHTSRFTALPRAAEPQSCLQEWCQSGKGSWTPTPALEGAGNGGLCWQDMKAALTLPWLCCPCRGGEGGTEGHLLPSTSCDLPLLFPRAGGIYDVPLQGWKATLEIRGTDPSVLTQSFCGFGLQIKPPRTQRAQGKSRQHLPRVKYLDIDSQISSASKQTALSCC